MRIFSKFILISAAALSNICLLMGQEIAGADSTKNKQTQESERNVMLNAANANEPRRISIGLPGGDTYVMENGLPALYYTNPQPRPHIGEATEVWGKSDLSLFPKPLSPQDISDMESVHLPNWELMTLREKPTIRPIISACNSSMSM